MDERKFSACITNINALSMRFRWNEENQNRNTFFSNLCGDKKEIVPLELIHSKLVLAVDSANDTNGLQADGIITCNHNLIPVLTVADCVPIYLWDEKTGCFGVLHSGWKGTGIITEALSVAKKTYGACSADFKVMIGPHIRNCCYKVDKDRADYFIENFTSECIESVNGESTFSLSLENANTFLLEQAGVKKENIYASGDCTCCTKDRTGKYQYGSFRRETAHCVPNSPLKEMQKLFTPMAAFMYVGENALQNTDKMMVHKI